MKVTVQSVLFRKLTKSNAGAMLGLLRGEYDLRYGRRVVQAVQEFTNEVPEEDPTELGGWTKNLHVEAFDGPNPAPAVNLRLRYMGPNASRADDTYIAGQSTVPYPLWAPSRARPGASVAEDLEGDVALLIKDSQARYHARWVLREDLSNLPDELQDAIDQNGTGVYIVPNVTEGPTERVAEIIDLLRTHHNVLLYGPPGTGKTHLVSEVRRHFAGSGWSLDTSAEKNALAAGPGSNVMDAWATFHQSYSYEDFLIGLRPNPLEKGGFTLEPRPGILLELAEWARASDHASLLIIDEINRGNVSRIFGEFITLMEPDKRLTDDGTKTDQTVEVRLPFVDEGQAVNVKLPTGDSAVPVPFTMPLRVFTLATMNSVDKSVAPLDAALRRRFHIVNVAPQLDAFSKDLGLDGRPLSPDAVPQVVTTASDARWLAIALLTVLNERITLFLGPDFQLGEWFLKSVVSSTSDDEAKRALADVWRTALMPQLEDYFVGRSDQLSKVLGDPKPGELALVVDEPDTAFVELGAVRSIRANPRADDDALLAFMVKVARAGLPNPVDASRSAEGTEAEIEPPLEAGS